MSGTLKLSSEARAQRSYVDSSNSAGVVTPSLVGCQFLMAEHDASG